ncbi:MAG: hypothetical protein HYU77_03165 [Betaproteobacteria bacterium]|nr:hypothetical protein [Betaproteobacteria bacterium]
MLQLQLPALDPKAAPPWPDRAACEQWLSQLQFTNIRAVQEDILGRLVRLNSAVLPAAQRLELLEALRETVAYVQSEYRKKLAGKPLPLDDSENAIFSGLMTLWKTMAEGYRRCLQACIEGDPGVASRNALVCQRLLRYAGVQVLEHVLACLELPTESWQELHCIFGYAESEGVAQAPVEDPLSDHNPSSCRNIYVQVLLADLANPYELPRKQIQCLSRWLDTWSDAVTVGGTLPPKGDGAPPLAVDLDADGGAQPADRVPWVDTVRYLDVSEVSKELRDKISMLRQGQSPHSLGLGNDCPQPGCGKLLSFLHRNWCEGAIPRFLERVDANRRVQACFGQAVIHYFVSGKAFSQPRKKSKDLSEQQRKEIEAFGHVISRTGKVSALQSGFTQESWHVVDQSALGLRVVRPGGDGHRVSPNQLIGVDPADGSPFMLGVVRWLVVMRNGDLKAGIRTFPGAPQAVAVRQTGLNVKETEKYVQAFLLPQVPALQIPASVVLPVGWFVPKRVIEMFTDMGQNLRLTGLVERGLDFERVSFDPA